MRTINHRSDLEPTFSGAVLPAHRPTRTSSAPNQAGAVSWLRRARATVRLWQKRSRDRQELLTLDDHVLRDIGLTPHDVALEARKPFWRI